MTAKSNIVRIGALVSLSSLLCVTLSSRLSAQEAQERERERPELPPLTAQIPPEEALAAIKRRAMKILEQRRAARRLRTYLEFSQVFGYETNPSTSGPVDKGDSYFEEDAYLSLTKPLTPTLRWESTYYGVYLKYLDYGDGDYTSHTLTPLKLRWQPGRMWRLESWLDYDLNYYPTAKDSGYRQLKPALRIRQNLFGTTFHQFQYEFFERDYMTRNARDGAGNETLSNRVDHRHRMRYKVGATVKDGLPLKNALFSVENEWYKNDSNDARSDFYDYEVWKIANSLNGSLTKKLSLNGSFAFERKNYLSRKVTGHGITPEARYDDKYTLSASASYDLTKTWRMATGLNFDHLNSNEPTGEYDNMKYSLTLTAQF